MIKIGVTDKKPVGIDLQSLMATRLLITASSGGGKSWAIRRLLEQSAGDVQQIVLDLEGEFVTLREKFDYVLAGAGGDVPAHPKAAAMLARKLRELRVSAILDLYEIKRHEQKAFVRLFLEALVSAPKRLWTPMLLVIDEAHHWAPEKGRAESLSAVIDVCTRGRKRGICPVLATQRLSQLNKDAAANQINKMVGQIGLDIDQKRAADEIGFRTVDDRRGLRDLRPGQFHVFGPAWRGASKPLPGVNLITVGDVRTTHAKSGQADYEPPAPTAKIKSVLADLADLPEKAEQERKSVEDLKRELAQARREVTLLRKEAGAVSSEELAAAVAGREAALGALSIAKQELKRIHDQEAQRAESAEESAIRIAAVIEGLDGKAVDIRSQRPLPAGPRRSPASLQIRPAVPVRAVEVSDGLTRPQQRVLDCIYELRAVGIEPADRRTVAAHAGYSPGGGAFNNLLGHLRTAGLVDYPGPGTVTITVAGTEAANPPGEHLTGDGLRASWLNKVTAPQRKILSVLIDVYPDDLSREDLAGRSGYAEGGGAFNNYVGRLCTLGAAAKSGAGRVRASGLLFPEELA